MAWPRVDPFAIGQPYGAASAMSPAGWSLPPLCLMAYAVTGESADIAAALPRMTALVASSWLVYGRILIAFLPALVQALLLAGSSSVCSVVVSWTAMVRPHALVGSTVLPFGDAQRMPALK